MNKTITNNKFAQKDFQGLPFLSKATCKPSYFCLWLNMLSKLAIILFSNMKKIFLFSTFLTITKES